MLTTFTIGDLGHLFVIISFIASAIAAFAYWRNAVLVKNTTPLICESHSWKTFGRTAFFVHAVAVVGVVATLFYIIYNHRYEYYYAWDHSSNDLPVHYMISCFWEGQEGSFLLWIFWHVCLGLVLIKVNKTWEAPLMAVFCLVQTFLASMIIGVVLPYLEVKIGSSPFILFKDQMGNLPVFDKDPNFVPKDGSGLNALLQNYWMVIHPPTLFLGFAATIVPFAYCIAGLWQGKYREWIRPALPWALFGALILGAGILMGGYWAYETLNFGGYWNWDPVENAVYVPWLILIASIHTMITFRSSEKALKASIILVIVSFLLILYSTFLTRSGILGESSVHSFTDLGLSGQLGIYLAAFFILSVILLIISWNRIPRIEGEPSVYSREFWIFIGITVMGLAALQVLTTTSIPVYNSLLGLFGVKSNIAPPGPKEQIIHYSQWQMWFSMAIAILSGIGQFFWWKKMDSDKLKNALAVPFIITLLSASLVLFLGQIKSIPYILLLTSSLFCVIANLFILGSVVKNNFKLSGGAIAHIGVGLMLIGILYSSGYSKVVSLNLSGEKHLKDAEENKESVYLERGDLNAMGEYALSYEGTFVEAKDYPDYVSREKIFFVDEKQKKAIAKEPLIYNEKVYFKSGDTLEVNSENNYYKINFKKEDEQFTLYPRVQKNSQMGYVVSPDIERFFSKDLYSYINYSSDLDEEEKEWSEPENHPAQIKDTMFFHDYIAILDSIVRETSYPGIELSKNGLVISARIRILGKNKTYIAKPALIVQSQQEGYSTFDEIKDLGIRISFGPMVQKDGAHIFNFAVSSAPKDYIILKAIEKPMINVLWIGTLLLMLGLFIAIVRRYTEFAKMRDKGVE